MDASRVVWLVVKSREEPLKIWTRYKELVWGTKCGRFAMSKDEVLTSSFDMDNSDGKASLKRQKSSETTTDTRGMSKFYWFYM